MTPALERDARPAGTETNRRDALGTAGPSSAAHAEPNARTYTAWMEGDDPGAVNPPLPGAPTGPAPTFSDAFPQMARLPRWKGWTLNAPAPTRERPDVVRVHRAGLVHPSAARRDRVMVHGPIPAHVRRLVREDARRRREAVTPSVTPAAADPLEALTPAADPLEALHALGARLHECTAWKGPWFCPSCRGHVADRAAARKRLAAALKPGGADAEAAARADVDAAEACLDALGDGQGCGCWWKTAARGYGDRRGRAVADLEAGRDAGRLPGILPASVGVYVLDVDWDKERRTDAERPALRETVAALVDELRPDAWYWSVSGWGVHLLFRLEDADPIHNRKWTHPAGTAAGEVRHATGYACFPWSAVGAWTDAARAIPRPADSLPAWTGATPPERASDAQPSFRNADGQRSPTEPRTSAEPGDRKPGRDRTRARRRDPWTTEDVRAALDHVHASTYDEWIAIGQALHSWDPGAVGLNEWERWSAGFGHGDAGAAGGKCAEKWSTFTQTGGRARSRTLGTLDARAKAGGWSGRAVDRNRRAAQGWKPHLRTSLYGTLNERNRT